MKKRKTAVVIGAVVVGAACLIGVTRGIATNWKHDVKSSIKADAKAAKNEVKEAVKESKNDVKASMKELKDDLKGN